MEVAQIVGLRFAIAAGAEKRAAWEIAIAVSEAASNIVKHAGYGEIYLRSELGSTSFVEFEALDRGPGIDDVEAAMRDGVSENIDFAIDPNVARRRGLGLGLGAISRLTDELELSSRAGGGTVLRCRKYL